MSTDSDDTLMPEPDSEEPKPYTDWNIQNEGRSWGPGEARERFDRTIELKIEMYKGKLFWSDETRITMLGLLLEGVGADRAVQLGDPEVWRRAVAKLGKPEAGRP
jgi:hypothetical protein